MGKTMSDAYLEFENQATAAHIVMSRNRSYLKGRLVALRHSKKQELFRRLFPHWNPEGDETERRTYLKRDEINGILLVCKHYKVMT
jgi:hypothetical protein